MYDIEKLLTDMRCEVTLTHQATMPIPLYDMMKEAVRELKEAQERIKELEAALKFYREKWVTVSDVIIPAASLLIDKGSRAAFALTPPKQKD